MTEAEVFAAIQELVASGEYRDEMPGLPGVHMTGGGVFQDNRRLYSRPSREYAEAKAAGLTDRPPR